MAEYIEREKLMRDIEKYHVSDGKFQHWVEIQLAADVAPVVRCKDCIHWDAEGWGCSLFLAFGEGDFCSYGERKEGAENG